MAPSLCTGVAAHVVAMALVTLSMVAQTNGELKTTCDDIVPLGQCTKDQGQPLPQDRQAVYLRNPKKAEHWFYPPGKEIGLYVCYVYHRLYGK